MALLAQRHASTSTPGVTIIRDVELSNAKPRPEREQCNSVRFTLANTATCGAVINFTLTVNVSNSNDGPQTSTFSVQTGQPNITVASYTGPPVFVDPNTASTVTIPLVVSGLSGPVGDLNFSFDGTSCTSAIGAPTVGFDHSWVGDLRITLTSPSGTTVTLMDQPGGPLNSGNNFCNTVLDDSAIALIQASASRLALDGIVQTGQSALGVRRTERERDVDIDCFRPGSARRRQRARVLVVIYILRLQQLAGFRRVGK